MTVLSITRRACAFAGAVLIGVLTLTPPLIAHDAPTKANDSSGESAASALAEGQASAKQPMKPHDLVTMPRLGAPIVTKSGTFAAYSVTYTDAKTYDRFAAHYLLDLVTPGADPIELDLQLSAYALAFAADDYLYFLSDEHPDARTSPRMRLWRTALEANGNASPPQMVAELPGTDISGFLVSPTNDKLALIVEAPRSCTRFPCGPTAETVGSGRLYAGENGFYRHWDRWETPGAFNRVFVFDLVRGQITGDGTPIDGVDPESGITGHTPTMPFGGLEDLAWASDGSGLYFVAREANAAEPTSTDLDIYLSDLTEAAPNVLTGANPAHDSAPTPSPDGKTLAYLAMARPGYESDQMVIHLLDIASGQTRALTSKTDLSFGSLAWSADGSALIATAGDVLDTPAFRIDAQTGAVTRLDLIAGNEAHIGAIRPLTDSRLLFTRDSIGSPAELYLAQGMQQARPLTDIVTTKLGQLASTRTTRFSFEGAEGDTVWGQITRLEQFDGQMPAILYVHGGPQGSFNDGWSSRWNPRLLASQGYAVISIDFHGSSGYGQEFMDSINRDWGGKPLVDLQKGLKAALKLDRQIDGGHACAMGASYGGYMMNWIEGQWPGRFQCLVQHDGIFDTRSFYYSTEELWFPRWDFGGSYQEARETYERWNPANHVDKWQTPMLVITGEYDFRVPYTQGLQSFTALQERGIESQLLVFPDENHWVLGPRNSLQWHNTVFAWLDRWLKPEGGEAGE